MIAALPVSLGPSFVLSIARLPGFPIDRTAAAIIGACLMIAYRFRT